MTLAETASQSFDSQKLSGLVKTKSNGAGPSDDDDDGELIGGDDNDDLLV